MREAVEGWLRHAVATIDPAALTASHLQGEPADVIAIGKAAPGMCRGAEQALGSISGICVSTEAQPVPDGIEMVVGDHPIPGERSLQAGRAALAVASAAERRILALISGGGSALCEVPREGIDLQFIQDANDALLMGGASIEEINLVRGHLSAFKCGGLARVATRPVETLVISDVGPAGPEVVASGPTLPMRFDPGLARETLVRHGIEVPPRTYEVMATSPGPPGHSTVTVLADGTTAAEAVAGAAHEAAFEALVLPEWIEGALPAALDGFLAQSGRGVTIACGESYLQVTGSGRGGRNTHAALLAATSLAGTDGLFAAFASDGVDGSSGSSGAIVDGETTERGGDHTRALEEFDSAAYLATTGDLLAEAPTGTNVADLWVLVKP